jgi:predicted enzyme related to lactoylglutathione lyase
MRSLAHVEIYAEEPPKLVEFYRALLGCHIEKAPGVNHAAGISAGECERSSLRKRETAEQFAVGDVIVEISNCLPVPEKTEASSMGSGVV